jgi:Ca2+:H+ antiporter
MCFFLLFVLHMMLYLLRSLLLSLLQIPFCVVIGWIMGQPMDLNFKLFETATLFITVIVVAFFLQVSMSVI